MMSGGTTTSGNSQVRERTFQFEETLPSLPVPPLDKTLQRYLSSVEAIVSAEEYAKTAKIVADFERGVGRELHEKLVKKGKASKNWMEQWWEEKAYMEVRAPAAVMCNIVGGVTTLHDIWPPMAGTQLERAAIFTWYFCEHFRSIRKEELPIERSRDGKMVWSMEQCRGMYCCGRQPGLVRDSLNRHFKTELEGPCPHHIVVLSNGHLYRMKPFTESGELLSSHDIFRQLCYIKEQSSSTRGQGIGALSADDRTSYAKAYNYLCELDSANAEHFKMIEGSIASVQLMDGSPKNMTELYQAGIYGPNVHNRFFDKTYGAMIFENGTICCNGDHAPADGIVIVNHFYWVHQSLIKTGGAWPGGNTVSKNLAMPDEVIFTTDLRVGDDIAHATETYNKYASNADMLQVTFASMGKKWIRAQGFHPDAFLQLAFQYTYYTLHNKPAATYETATTRKYYHGRTETVRSCTTEAVNWVKAMMDKSTVNAEKLALFKKAQEKHLQLLKECAAGEGCDRHLMGLFIIAQDEGRPVPELYTDPSFTKSGGGGNFTLSTSLTGYVGVHGAVTAMTHDGYGLFYCFTDDSIIVNMSAYKSCPDTDLKIFFSQLTKSLVDMQKMLVAAKM